MHFSLQLESELILKRTVRTYHCSRRNCDKFKIENYVSPSTTVTEHLTLVNHLHNFHAQTIISVSYNYAFCQYDISRYYHKTGGVGCVGVVGVGSEPSDSSFYVVLSLLSLVFKSH